MKESSETILAEMSEIALDIVVARWTSDRGSGITAVRVPRAPGMAPRATRKGSGLSLMGNSRTVGIESAHGEKEERILTIERFLIIINVEEPNLDQGFLSKTP